MGSLLGLLGELGDEFLAQAANLLSRESRRHPDPFGLELAVELVGGSNATGEAGGVDLRNDLIELDPGSTAAAPLGRLPAATEALAVLQGLAIAGGHPWAQLHRFDHWASRYAHSHHPPFIQD
jgi:hypothetical protein